MATRGPEPLPITLVAGADLSTAQWAPVALSAGKAVVCNVPSDAFVGVLGGESKPRLNEHAGIVAGPASTKGRMGLAVTVGNYLTVQSGWFIPGNKMVVTAAGSWSNSGSKTNLVGLALETVASGAIGALLLYQTYTVINSN